MSQKEQKIKIVYVLSAAYSGSTLLGLALGKHSKITNLGEVINLESDYAEQTRCTCKESLSACPFWLSVKNSVERQSEKRLSFNLSRSGKREHLDRRGGWQKIQLLLGRRLESTYGEAYITRYRMKNENFFASVLQGHSDAHYLVDLSKSAERLDILLSSNKLDVWCIYLRRDPIKVYASTVKRPKRTRRFLGPKSLREAVWLRARTKDMERAFARVPDSKKINVDFSDFMDNPQSTLDTVLEQLNLESYPAETDNSGKFVIDPSKQHVYVGNRWLFDPKLAHVSIRERSDTSQLSFFQKLVFKSVWWRFKTL